MSLFKVQFLGQCVEHNQFINNLGIHDHGTVLRRIYECKKNVDKPVEGVNTKKQSCCKHNKRYTTPTK